MTQHRNDLLQVITEKWIMHEIKNKQCEYIETYNEHIKLFI